MGQLFYSAIFRDVLCIYSPHCSSRVEYVIMHYSVNVDITCKHTTCSGLMKTALNNVVLPTLFKVVNSTEQVDEPELTCNQV